MKFSLFFFPGDVDDPRRSYGTLARTAIHADAHGFDAVWLPERHFHAFGGLSPNPVVAASWLAAATTRLGLRAGSVLLPLHNPVRVAEDWSMVDNLSGGRVGIAAGMGWHADDFVLHPTGFEGRRDIAQQSLDILQRLWRGEPVEMVGGLGATKAVLTFPRPVQKELPVWITCTGAPATFMLAASGGYGALTYLVSQRLEDLGNTLAAYRRAFQPSASQPRPRVTAMVHAYIGRDQADVEEQAIEPLQRYLGSSVSLFKKQVPTGDAGHEALQPAEIDSLIRHTGERLRRTRSLVGTEAECVEMLDWLCEIGIDEVACLIDFGVPEPAILASLERLCGLKDRYAEVPAGGGLRTATGERP